MPPPSSTGIESYVLAICFWEENLYLVQNKKIRENEKEKTTLSGAEPSPGLLWLFSGVVVEQAVRVKPYQLLLLVIHQGRREQLDEVEVGKEGDAVVDGGTADGVVVLQAFAVGCGQVDHQVDLLAADVVDHVRALLLRTKIISLKLKTNKYVQKCHIL